MKKIFLLLCLVTCSASAGVRLDESKTAQDAYRTWRDERGLDFVLSNEKPFICAGLERIYILNPKGTTEYGCWMKIRNELHINYISNRGVVENLVLDATKFERQLNAVGQPAPVRNLPLK
jgi:hypothetical protein